MQAVFYPPVCEPWDTPEGFSLRLHSCGVDLRLKSHRRFSQGHSGLCDKFFVYTKSSREAQTSKRLKGWIASLRQRPGGGHNQREDFGGALG